MSEHLITLLTVAFTAVSSVMAYLSSLRNAKKLVDVDRKLVEVSIRMDGRMDELLRLNRSEAHQIGLNEGVASGELKAAILKADQIVTDGPVTVVGSPITVNGEVKHEEES